MSEEKKNEAKARRIKASKDIQAKVGTGQVSESVVKRAQGVIDNNQVDFVAVASPFLKDLREAIEAAKKSKNMAEYDIVKITKPMMNMKANAGSFKYELVSELAGSVLLLLENTGTLNRKNIQITDVTYKTMLLLVMKKIKGDGGDMGSSLRIAYGDMCQKFMPRTSA